MGIITIPINDYNEFETTASGFKALLENPNVRYIPDCSDSECVIFNTDACKRYGIPSKWITTGDVFVINGENYFPVITLEEPIGKIEIR